MIEPGRMVCPEKESDNASRLRRSYERLVCDLKQVLQI